MELELAATTRRDPFRNCGRIPCDHMSRDLPNPLFRLRRVANKSVSQSSVEDIFELIDLRRPC
jgi:hypothetical protein